MTTKTPISALQELMAAKKLPLPVYIEEGIGTHFKCTVLAAGVTATGVAASKKVAKHESAKKALEILEAKIKPQIVIVQSTTPSFLERTSFINYVGKLNEFASKRSFKYPDYEFVTGTVLSAEFYVKCSFLQKEILGKGMNKKDAKQDAARRMLELVTSMDPTVLVNSASTIINQSSKFDSMEKEKILNMYKMLSLNDEGVYIEKKSTLEAVPTVFLTEHESVDALKRKLVQHGIDYTITELQKNPCMMYIRVKGTDLYFVATGANQQEATKRVLLDVFEVLQSGISLNTNDLISFH